MCLYIYPNVLSHDCINAYPCVPVGVLTSACRSGLRGLAAAARGPACLRPAAVGRGCRLCLPVLCGRAPSRTRRRRHHMVGTISPDARSTLPHRRRICSTGKLRGGAAPRHRCRARTRALAGQAQRQCIIQYKTKQNKTKQIKIRPSAYFYSDAARTQMAFTLDYNCLHLTTLARKQLIGNQQPALHVVIHEVCVLRRQGRHGRRARLRLCSSRRQAAGQHIPTHVQHQRAQAITQIHHGRHAVDHSRTNK